MKRILPVVFSFLLSFLLTACERSTPAEVPAAATPAGAPPPVEVVPVASETLHLVIDLPGELTPYQAVAIYPRVSGFLEDIRVDRGSKVRHGEVLARLSAPELAAQRAEATSRATGARSTMDRLRAASSTPGAVAGHDLELADATLKAEEARVSSLKSLESYLVIRAPFDGAVTERNVHPGALVGPPAGPGAMPMLRIEQLGRLRLTVAVPESDVAAIGEGSPAEFTVAAWPGRRFSGTVSRVSRAIDPKTRTMPVELDVNNADGGLASGMYASVRWPIARRAPSLLVPATAIAQTTERTFVDRVGPDGTVEQVAVRRGAAIGERVEVIGAISAGDMVLRRGSEELQTGVRVTPRRSVPDGGASR
jgi:RND family efflux transporter MFP subunit